MAAAYQFPPFSFVTLRRKQEVKCLFNRGDIDHWGFLKNNNQFQTVLINGPSAAFFLLQHFRSLWGNYDKTLIDLRIHSPQASYLIVEARKPHAQQHHVHVGSHGEHAETDVTITSSHSDGDVKASSQGVNDVKLPRHSKHHHHHHQRNRAVLNTE